MDLSLIRRTIIAALASDDELMELLVLKGGNALELVHKIGARASLDIDYSIEGDFDDLDWVRDRLFRALDDRFSSLGLVVIKKLLTPRPSNIKAQGSRWGGYTVTFKLVPRERHQTLGGDENALAREALLIGSGQRRTFTIQISKYEYCTGKEEAVVDDYTCYVYTLTMIAAEKLRALCQQMPEYVLRTKSTPRPRDFYDIHAVLESGVSLKSSENIQMIREMFAAKEVPLELLSKIANYREFHRAGWESVENAVRGVVRTYDYYFDYLLEIIGELQFLWKE